MSVNDVYINHSGNRLDYLNPISYPAKTQPLLLMVGKKLNKIVNKRGKLKQNH